MVDDSSRAGGPPPEADATTAAQEPPAASPYPVRLDIEEQSTSNRFWAIPLIGLVAKLVILTPHVVIIYLLIFVLGLVQLVLWIPVLFAGKYPEWGYSLVGGYLRWMVRISAYAYGLTDRYPPFSLGYPTSPEPDGYPVSLTLSPAATAARWTAIPLVGLIVKAILVVPHAVIIYALGIVVELVLLIAWAPLLFTGVYPRWARDLGTGYLRWNVRTQTYFLGLTDRYPPFRIEN